MELCRQTKSAVPTKMMAPRHLRDAGISKRTLRLYRKEVLLFFTHLDVCQQRIPRSYHRLDELVAEYINLLFQEGEALTRAGWLMSGLKRFYPRVRRELTTSQQWYNNWAREHTPTRVTPIPWRVLKAMVGLCVRLEWPRLGLLFLVGFIIFLRTGELLNLQRGDIQPHRRDSVVYLRIAQSKTFRNAQQSLAHTDPVFADLVSALLGLFPGDAESWVWPYSLSFFCSCLSQVAQFLNVGHLNLVPYSLRRGGATYFYTLTNNLDFVMIRGRWKDATTARIYQDDARATIIRLSLPPTTLALLSRFVRVFSSFRSANVQVRGWG